MLPKQRLLWIPPGVDVGAPAKRVPPIPVDFDERAVDRLWTLYFHTDPDKPPELPYVAVHRRNAFLEDCIHDWNIFRGKLYYGSRVCDGGVWVLLDMK